MPDDTLQLNAASQLTLDRLAPLLAVTDSWYVIRTDADGRYATVERRTLTKADITAAATAVMEIGRNTLRRMEDRYDFRPNEDRRNLVWRIGEFIRGERMRRFA
jgi:hypothetical protein